MDTLVIQVHPLADCYNVALLGAVTDALQDAGVDSRTVRLCQDGTLGVDELTEVDHIVAVYPTWWGGLPSPLLDWFQKAVGPLVDGSSSSRDSPLRSVRRLSVVTSHGSSRLMNWAQGRSGYQTWTRVLLPLCAPDAEFDWISLYKIDRTTEAQRRRFIQQVGWSITTASASVRSTA
ncbi:MAG: NAD(P)H-dependent oxidoreductase [Acidimicrobiales bacterium]